jgi:hypothetical protein
MPSVAEPLTAPELRMLQAYAEGDADAVAALDPWARDPLVERGYLQRHERGMLVTPEGLAALLDIMPADVMRTASPPEDPPAASPGGATAPSRARRRSVAPS